MEGLMAELRRYLAAVNAFRAEGREPVWLAEQSGLDSSAKKEAER